MFHTKFDIRFRRLVLLEMNCFWEIEKSPTEGFNTMILVQGFCPLVTPTHGEFRLKRCKVLKLSTHLLFNKTLVKLTRLAIEMLYSVVGFVTH